MANCLTCIHQEVCKERIEIFNLLNVACQYEAHELVGEWVKNDNGTYSCSVCQSWIPEEQHFYARYCLHCGAKMVAVENPFKWYFSLGKSDDVTDMKHIKVGNVIYTQDNDKQGWTGKEVE